MIFSKHNRSIIYNFCLAIIFAHNTLHAKVDESTKARLLKKYQQTLEESCNSEQCNKTTEQLLACITAKINHDYYGATDAQGHDNLEQDTTTLQAIKNDYDTIWYRLFWLIGYDVSQDTAAIKEADLCLKNAQKTKSLFDRHAEYQQAQKIIAQFGTISTRKDDCKYWIAQKFSASHESAAQQCKKEIKAALSTIAKFQKQHRSQYPRLNQELSGIQDKLNAALPIVEELEKQEAEQEQSNKKYHEQKALQQKTIDAENRAAKAQEDKNRNEQEKIRVEKERILAIQQAAVAFAKENKYNATPDEMQAEMKNKQTAINALKILLNKSKDDEKTLSDKATNLQKIINAKSQYEKLEKEESDIEKQYEQSQIRVRDKKSHLESLKRKIHRGEYINLEELAILEQILKDIDKDFADIAKKVEYVNQQIPNLHNKPKSKKEKYFNWNTFNTVNKENDSDDE